MLALVALLAALAICAAPAAAKPRVPFMRGITLGEWGSTAYAPKATALRLRQLKQSYHVNSVTLLVVWNQPNGSSSKIAPGTETVPQANLVAAIRSARRLGMTVVLRPYVDPSDGTWRGLVHPANAYQWLGSYTSFITSYASLAAREHVSGYVVGSELGTFSSDAGFWRSLIHQVRGRFHGFITYQANWDSEAPAISWWDAVDAISISAYYELTPALNPSVSDIMRAWTTNQNAKSIDWFAQIDGLRAQYHLPVLFGEIGYRTVADAAARPWAVASPASVQFSVAAQRTAYEAAFRVWYRVPWFRGFHWWYVTNAAAGPRNLSGEDHQPAAATLRELGGWYGRKR